MSNILQKLEEMCVRCSVEDGNTSLLSDCDLLTIFSQLSMQELLQARRVCTRWEYIVAKLFATIKTFPCWDPQVQSFTRNVTFEAFPIVMEFCGNTLTEINFLQHGYMIDENSIKIISNSCPNLETFHLSHSIIDNANLKILAFKCNKIKNVTLLRCARVNDTGLWWFFNYLKNLTSFNLSCSLRVTGRCFSAIGSNLSTLILNENNQFCESAWLLIQLKCATLSQLQLINLVTLNNDDFTGICQICVSLKKLSLTSIYLPASSYQEIQHLTLLEELVIENETNLDDRAVTLIAENCPNLKIVNFSGRNLVSHVGVVNLAQCTNLVHLNLGYNDQINDECLLPIFNNGLLRRLCIKGCLPITNRSCIEVILKCKNLEWLDITACTRITSEVFDAFLNAFQARNNNCCLTVCAGRTCFSQENSNPVRHPLFTQDFITFDFSENVIRRFLRIQE